LARLAGLTESDVTAILSGHLNRYSLDTVNRLLSALGEEVKKCTG